LQDFVNFKSFFEKKLAKRREQRSGKFVLNIDVLFAL
jgi:hypothetical protein